MSTAKARVKETGRDHQAAYKALEEAEWSYDHDRREAIRAFEEQWREKHADRKKRIEDLREVLCAAREAYDSARAAVGVEEAGDKFGQIVVEWEIDNLSWYSKNRTWKKTGRKGRLDVWTRESVAPVGVRWSLPQPGSLYIRLLKGDGTDSAKFEQRYDPHHWLPEGEEPKPLKNPRAR